MCWGGVTAQRSGWTPVRQTGSHTITQSQPQPHNQHAHSHSHTATASTTYALVLFKMNTQQRPLLWCESSLGQQLDGSACGTGFGSCSFVGEPGADFGGGNAHEGRQASTGRHWRVPAAHHTHTPPYNATITYVHASKQPPMLRTHGFMENTAINLSTSPGVNRLRLAPAPPPPPPPPLPALLPTAGWSCEVTWLSTASGPTPTCLAIPSCTAICDGACEGGGTPWVTASVAPAPVITPVAVSVDDTAYDGVGATTAAAV